MDKQETREQILRISGTDVRKCMKCGKCSGRCPAYHEMDIRQLTDRLNELYHEANPDTRLKTARVIAGLSQSELAEISGVSVRTIQQYEQRQKSINRAKAETLLRLARVLCCDMEDLMEMV